MPYQDNDDLFEPQVATFYLRGLSGSDYRFFGDRSAVHIVETALSPTRMAYDLYMPVEALDRADLERRYPAVAAKAFGDTVFLRAGPAHLQAMGLAGYMRFQEPPAGATVCTYLN